MLSFGLALRVFVSVVAFMLSANLACAANFRPYPQRQVTPQDLYFGWAEKSGLAYHGQKGNMYAFRHDGRHAVIAAKFINGSWIEGATLIPERHLTCPDNLTRSMIAIQYFCAMASIGKFTQALGMADDFVNKALAMNFGNKVSNAFVACRKEALVIKGNRLVKFVFRRR